MPSIVCVMRSSFPEREYDFNEVFGLGLKREMDQVFRNQVPGIYKNKPKQGRYRFWNRSHYDIHGLISSLNP